MVRPRFEVDEDIRRAHTPAASLYCDAKVYDAQKKSVFSRTWHYFSHAFGLDEPGKARPVTLLPGCLDEPLLLVRDAQADLHCLSNVCTHRGNLIVDGEWTLDSLRCGYHGRRFHLDGTFAFMPGFEEAEKFPSEKDYLPRIPIAAWRGLVFASLAPAVGADEVVARVEQRVAGTRYGEWTFEPEAGYDLEIEANWVLCCENGLEGLHTPHIHSPFSGRSILPSPRTELWEHGALQTDPGSEGDPVFDLPEGHPDRGERIAAYHFWLFPATFLTIYPWGLALHALQPAGQRRTRVCFRSFAAATELRPPGTLEALRRTAEEDAVVIRSVQQGVESRLYRGGRYSPASEKCVHHFHRLLAGWMAGGRGAR